MFEAVLSTSIIMGWLGLILGILAIVNILTGILTNMWQNNEKFDIKKMFKGIIKVIAFFLCSAFVGVAFTMLPFINEMIINAFNVELISNDLISTFSSVGILGIIISTITTQGKKAIQGIINLANINFKNKEE